MKHPSRAMTIAGSSAGGSAGIQADLKTFQELDVYGMSIITAIVGRHPKTDKNGHAISLEAIEAQFSTAIKQVGVDGIKTGMLFSKEVIELVASLIESAPINHLVVDPVMIGKMNSKLLKDDAIEALKKYLIPLATIITPNIPEASVLLDHRSISTVDEMKKAAIDLQQLGSKNILIKGGRLEGPAVDVLFDGTHLTTFEAPRIDTVNTSGAGCSYSAAIAAQLTKEKNVDEAVLEAKQYITTAIEYSFSYTDVVGPTNHAAKRNYGNAHDIIVKNEKI